MSTQKVKKTKRSSRGGKSSSTYLSAEGLHNLKYYRYSGTDKSLLANLFLKRHWDWCTVTFFPIWMAPNLITLCGLICIVANMISLLYYCPNTVGCVAPSWVYALAALGVYAYQIFDNIDGRQARRTGTSSPLGELFDHGCDSLFVPFAGVLMFNAMHLGPWTAWAGFWATAMPFFMAHWEEYHTGELILGVLANPTEGQFVMCALLLTAAIKGPAMWSTSWKTALGVESLAADLPDLSVTNAILGLLFIGGFTMAFVNTVVVLRNVKKHKSNLLRSLLLLFPLAASGLSSTAWFHLSKINLLQNYTTAAIFFAGLQFSYILNRMLIARITRTEYNVWNPVPLLPIVGPLFCTFLSNNGLVSELQLFYGVLGVTALIYVHFVCDVVGHLADHLGISCFTIPYPKRKSVIAAVAAAKKAD
ncbi:CDPalcohol phosphatidyltransferase superfamily protein [Acanthamoeba castellanii str. Neff]|uniref:CDPalcohol phosphatidyltransferase superfamily protein n=1 Tax=Acanthamoeba castellanii (strain ATCC 30010 / Neff) TaxID=1257118 RepID=L8GTC5_ACACF|nr:CDPalcohol phosphatidyltransferase superfamily protein [Acanthamoeba castellanii str. Neff]ELR16152.1 CDPalcohol phosphatidyltransferase superfamily protein [Acanthamoeba castellanii str. Neff]